jgi:DNA repair photolyase
MSYFLGKNHWKVQRQTSIVLLGLLAFNSGVNEPLETVNTEVAAMKRDRGFTVGRGAGSNPPNRFETLWYVRDTDSGSTEDPAPGTRFLKDLSRSIITYNDSPDVGFDASINPYRGCEHGCIYCYARPTHEYIGFSAGLDFETKILVKEDAPNLLRRELSSPKWKPQVIGVSGVTDPYQPVERRLRLTRSCLEVLLEFLNPVVIVTKNHLVTRDLDLLAELAHRQAAAVFLSVTTLDESLRQILEPRASHPTCRLAAIEKLAQAGVPTGVLVAPVIPGLTDHELPAIIAACARAGASFAGYVPLRLPYAVAALFEQWLTRHLPDRKEKVLSRIRAIRGGKLNDPRFISRMKGEGVFSEQVAGLFTLACRRAGIRGRGPSLSTAAFHRPTGAQLSLF